MKKTRVYPRNFFARPTVEVAKLLPGAMLCRRMDDGTIISAPIVEVEAYTMDDPACHASRGMTPRTEIMFGRPGFAYVYFIYGMYFCLNVVTEPDGVPGAVLIRAIGVEGGNGPGKLCRLLDITREHNGVDLCDPKGVLWIEQPAEKVHPNEIGVSIRVGISVAQERPWRFFLNEHPYLSVKKVKPHVRKKRPSAPK